MDLTAGEAATDYPCIKVPVFRGNDESQVSTQDMEHEAGSGDERGSSSASASTEAFIEESPFDAGYVTPMNTPMKEDNEGSTLDTQPGLSEEEYNNYLQRVEDSLMSAAEAADKIQYGGRADLVVAYAMHMAGLLKTSGNVGVPAGPLLQVASATLAKEKLMAITGSCLRVVADIVENKQLMRLSSSTLRASAMSLNNEQIASTLNSTIEAAGTVLESELVRKQISRISSFAEQLMGDPTMQEQGKAIMKRLEDISKDEDVHDTLDSVLELAQGTMENQLVRSISSKTVDCAGAVVESRVVQSAGSAVGSLLTSSPVKALSSLTVSTVSSVAGNQRVQNVVGAAVDTTAAVLTSESAVKATSLGLNTTFAVAAGVARWANHAKKVAFPGKGVDDIEHDLSILEEEMDTKLEQLKQEEAQLIKEEKEARIAARASLARLRRNQSTQQELNVQLSKRKRQLLQCKAEAEWNSAKPE